MPAGVIRNDRGKPRRRYRLKLTGFRNYAWLDLVLDARPVCLFGPNGAGKTNLVEAVSFLGPGRGLRAAGSDAVRQRLGEGHAPVWAVHAEAQTADGPVTLATGADPDNPARRKTRLEGVATTQTQLARLFARTGSGRARAVTVCGFLTGWYWPVSPPTAPRPTLMKRPCASASACWSAWMRG